MLPNVMEIIQSRPRTSAAYGCFALGCMLVYRSLEAKAATGKYDYVLTLSAALQVLAFVMLVFGTKSQVAEGISEMSLWAFFIAHVTRLSTTFWGPGYTPEDTTADIYLYQILELIGVLVLAFKLLSITTVRSVQAADPEKKQVLGGMIVTGLVLGWYTKSTGHDDYFADLSWMFSVWLDAMALIPQVHLMSSVRIVDESAVHFAAVTLLAGLAFAGYWSKLAVDNWGTSTADNYNHFLLGIAMASLLRIVCCAMYFGLFMRTTKGYSSGGGEHTGYDIVGTEEL